jgi:hypothetical protein
MATLAVTNTFAAGTTIVAADVNTNFTDIESFVNSSPGLVQDSLVDAQGDLLAASADNTIVRLGVGTDTYVLTADSGEATGLIWAAPTTGDISGITTAANSSLSGGATSGNVTLIADVNNSTVATATTADYVLIADTNDSNATKKALISDITAAAPQGTVTAVTGTAPIVSSGGTTPAISVTTNDAQLILNNTVFN